MIDKPLRDKRFPRLAVLLDTAEPHVSLHVRTLYVEYAARMGEPCALDLWHKLRSDQFRHAAGSSFEAQTLADLLRNCDQADAMHAEWKQGREAANAYIPYAFDEEEDGSPVTTRRSPRRDFLEPAGLLFGIFLMFAVGVIVGQVWSWLQRGGGR